MHRDLVLVLLFRGHGFSLFIGGRPRPRLPIRLCLSRGSYTKANDRPQTHRGISDQRAPGMEAGTFEAHIHTGPIEARIRAEKEERSAVGNSQ